MSESQTETAASTPLVSSIEDIPAASRTNQGSYIGRSHY